MNNEMFYNLIGKRLQDMFDTFMGSGSDGSMHARDELRNLGWELFKQHPIVGYGFSNFVTYTREVGYFMHTYSHDNFVELLSTLGLIGTSLFYIPLTDICFNIYFASKKAKNKNLGILIFVFMILQIVFSSYSMFYHDEFYFIFASCGYMYYYINYKSKKRLKFTGLKTITIPVQVLPVFPAEQKVPAAEKENHGARINNGSAD